MKTPNNKQEIFFKQYFKDKLSETFSKRKQDVMRPHLNQRRVSKTYNPKTLEEQFTFQTIPEIGYSEDDYFTELEQKLLPTLTHVGTPNFMGHMTTALPNFIPEVASLIASLNQNVVKIETSQSATFYERQAIAMLHKLMYNNTTTFYNHHIHKKSSTLGNVTSGGTIANITALQCARNIAFPKIEHNGYSTMGNGIVICSELGHYSIKKAMGLLGLGSKHLIIIPTDDKNKIRIDLLKQTIEKCHNLEQKIISIIGIAGTTECGSIDPLNDLAELAEKHNIYFHVDAAWGGPIQFSETYKYLLKGIERADSITIDGHKQLYLPMGIGLILFKDPKTAQFIERESEYIIRKTSCDLGKRSIEGSRPFHSLYIQAGLKLLGKQKYAWLIEKGIQTTRELVDYINTLEDFELLTFAETNIFLYRHIPKEYKTAKILPNKKLNAFNKALQKQQMERGNTFVSYTTIALKKYNQQRIVGLRVVIANPLITLNHFKTIIKEQRQLALEIPCQ